MRGTRRLFWGIFTGLWLGLVPGLAWAQEGGGETPAQPAEETGVALHFGLTGSGAFSPDPSVEGDAVLGWFGRLWLGGVGFEYARAPHTFSVDVSESSGSVSVTAAGDYPMDNAGLSLLFGTRKEDGSGNYGVLGYWQFPGLAIPGTASSGSNTYSTMATADSTAGIVLGGGFYTPLAQHLLFNFDFRYVLLSYDMTLTVLNYPSAGQQRSAEAEVDGSFLQIQAGLVLTF